MQSMISAAGITSSIRQPLVLPTSMYSMNRKANSGPRKRRAMGRILASLTPRLTTMLIFTGRNPACRAASIPASTRATGKPTSFIAAKTLSSSESRLTVTRCSPAARNSPACAASKDPLVVSVKSRMPSTPASIRTNRPKSRRSSGSPPVRRIFSTPKLAKMRASRVISSNVSNSLRGRNRKSVPKTSRGMQ